MAFQQWVGVSLFVLGTVCLWWGGRMGRLLPKPWSGPPHQWLPEYRRIIKRSLIVLGAAMAVTAAGIAILLWSI